MNSRRTSTSLEYINKQSFLLSSSSWLSLPFTFKSSTINSTLILNFISSSRACKSHTTSILSFFLRLRLNLTSILLTLWLDYIHNIFIDLKNCVEELIWKMSLKNEFRDLIWRKIIEIEEKKRRIENLRLIKKILNWKLNKF